MRVSIKLAGPLSRHYKISRSAKNEEVEIPEGSNVEALLKRYNVPPKSVNLIVVNRRRADMSTVLKDNDQVWAIPLAAGG